MRRFALNCALLNELLASANDTRKPEKLLETAKRLRINPDEIRKTLKAEQAANKTSLGNNAGMTDAPLKPTKARQLSAA